ncbi:type VI secretion system contractile sheath large subunit [Edwardsiella ictaluri]|uniref:type VI secretion system contractile sheath large subunit n=1 Tax=Edwardsiella ictaluri TaxID=67780 RepID=UPI003784BA93
MSEQNLPESAAVESAAPEDSLLDSIIAETRMARSDLERERARDLLGEWVSEVLSGTVTVSGDVLASIEARIAQIDALLSAQLSTIMHEPAFQKLEGSWRGLHYLVHQSETGTGLKIRMLNVSRKDLIRDFKSAAEFDQSALFKKVYEEEYGTFWWCPFAAMIGDYEFSNHPEDLFLLEEISHVAAAAHAPFLSAASAGMFGLDSLTELSIPRDLAKGFDTVEYAKWKSLRQSEDARYIALALPHVLGRLPYGAATVPVEAFNFEEDVNGKEHGKYLWLNAAYALGTRLTQAYAKYGWCAAIRGVEGGGLVEGLPAHTFTTDDGEVELKCPTEVAITDRREKELADLGFIALTHCKGTDYAAFFSTQSAQKPKEYDSDSANANARIACQLQYIMATSRFAHYLKSMVRDKLGSFMSRSECEYFLNQWISNYVVGSDDAGQDIKAKYPLREARIDVSDIPGKPGFYKAVAYLKPHFQLEGLTASLRLVADLPPPAQG